MTTIRTDDIRTSFLEYFTKRDHKLVESSPVIPFEDPTILFINAGMNQFKDIFTGKRKRDYPRACSAQKCIRAGGKHNDLDNVGFTARHHTFFEMLGNFSFGDYFKEQAIAYAWEWVTKEMKLPVNRLYATVYTDDDEAFALWEKIAPELKNGRIMRFGKKDNYWSMGDIGPCGPCSEIHFDRGEKYGTGPEDKVNGETDRFVEIWNLVFMQYEQTPDGKLLDLPKPSVDTGAGLERIAAIMQNCDTNYGIDIFQQIIKAVSELTGAKYEENRTSHHVVADHIRALTFALADGAGFSIEGRGSVLRKILHRAVRHGWDLGAQGPFLFNLVPAVVEVMGDVYPEIREKQDLISAVMKPEEESFLTVLEGGIRDMFITAISLDQGGEPPRYFKGPTPENLREVQAELRSKNEAKKERPTITGKQAFEWHDTQGRHLDFMVDEAAKYGIEVDIEGFNQEMGKQQERSRTARMVQGVPLFSIRELTEELESSGLLRSNETTFLRELKPVETEVVAVAIQQQRQQQPIVGIVLRETPFYAESGGQIGDKGTISSDKFVAEVLNMHLHRGYYIHECALKSGDVRDVVVGAKVTAQVDAERRWDIMRNHTATHLAHAALRQVLGDHVRQSGSYVGPDRLRFDFSHHQPMTPDEIARVEQIVNEQILRGVDVATEIKDVEEAKKSGAMALFGEKYGDRVRVVSVGEGDDRFSMELCGGTHVQNVSQIGPFFITVETGIASGVRRLEAVTGREAQKLMLEHKRFVQETSRITGRPENEALAAVEQLRADNAALQKEVKKVKAQMVAGGSQTLGDEKKIGNVALWTHNFGETDRDTMSAWIDNRKEQQAPLVALALGRANGKVMIMLAASNAAVKGEKIDAGMIARDLLGAFGGRGGGKPAFAQGGVPDNTPPEAVFGKLAEMLGGK